MFPDYEETVSDNQQQNKEFMTQSFGDSKLDKSTELNSSMSISPSSPDEYTRTIGGNLNG